MHNLFPAKYDLNIPAPDNLSNQYAIININIQYNKLNVKDNIKIFNRISSALSFVKLASIY